MTHDEPPLLSQPLPQLTLTSRYARSFKHTTEDAHTIPNRAQKRVTNPKDGFPQE